jgi:ABC-type multidrug transport system ATPase subunit
LKADVETYWHLTHHTLVPTFCRSRLAGIANKEDTDSRIETLLRKLGLSEQGDTIVGDLFFMGLSGGQQRRLSLALEALSEV